MAAMEESGKVPYCGGKLVIETDSASSRFQRGLTLESQGPEHSSNRIDELPPSNCTVDTALSDII